MKGIAKKTTLAAAAAAGLVLGGQAWAAPAAPGGTSTNGSGPPGDTGPTVTQQGREGKVTGVDKNKGVISLDSQDKRVEVSPGTVFYKNGQPASLNDIQPGDEVRASYINGSPIHAYKIEANTPRGGTSHSSLSSKDSQQ